ncbi:hypothetical protein [Williamsia sp.]|uniref:hypothetical protein n=1 Tax=Williamsia sp. TaxID=1872085 RepID=UPI002F94C199
MKILVDARIVLLPVDTIEEKSLLKFWSSLVDWSTDKRLVMGSETLRFVLEQYADRKFPESDIAFYPRELRNEYRRAFHSLISRQVDSTARPPRRSLDPAYVGGNRESEVLQLDISGSVGNEVVAIATIETSWSRMESAVAIDPAPPESLELCFEPHRQLSVERTGAIAGIFSGQRLHIVGGKASEHVVEAICRATGLSLADIEWIPSEKGKKPRDLDKRWGNLRPGKDIALCVTGRIGHSEARAAKIAAVGCGVVYFEVESVNEIAVRLVSEMVSKPPAAKP